MAAKAQPAHRHPAPLPRISPRKQQGPGTAGAAPRVTPAAGPGRAAEGAAAPGWAGSRGGNGNGSGRGTGAGTGTGRERERAVLPAQGRSRHKGERNPALPSPQCGSLCPEGMQKGCPSRAVKGSIPGPALGSPGHPYCPVPAFRRSKAMHGPAERRLHCLSASAEGQQFWVPVPSAQGCRQWRAPPQPPAPL